MTVRDVTWMNASTGQPDYSAADARVHDSALLNISDTSTRILGTRSGVVPAPSDAGLKCTHNGLTPGTITVPPGQAWIDGSLTIGAYLVTCEAAENFTVTAAGSVSRTDRVWIRARDSEVDGSVGTNRNGVIEYAAGNAGTGAPQAVPNHALLLCELTVPVSGTPTLTDKRLYCPRMDSVGLMVRTQAERDLFEPYAGMGVYRIDTGQVEVWTGSAWKQTFGPVWSNYTPTWSATVTNPTLNNGTLEGRVSQVGQMVFFKIKLTIGSSTALGSGNYRWTLPVTAVDDRIPLGGAYGFDTSASNHELGSCFVYSGETTMCRARDHSNTFFTPGNPYPWNTGDEIQLQGFYEAA